MQKICLFAVACIFFFSCKNEKTAPEKSLPATALSIEKTWSMFVGDTKNLPPKNECSPLQARMTEGWYGVKGRIGFSWSFFGDGTLTEFSGQNYRQGQWKYADETKKSIVLTFPNIKDEVLSIPHLDSDSLAIGVGADKKLKVYGFKTDGATYEKSEQNPYHPSNNLWRTKPATAETDAQIHARMKNHLHHLCLILEAALSHNLKVVSFRASPSNVHQYNGGVGLEPDANLSEAWLDCFFNKSDALKASRMLEDSMTKNKSIKLNAEDVWVKKNLAVLRNLWEQF